MRVRTIIRNIISNWLAFAVNAGVAMFLTPYVLHRLGDSRYGIWVLTFSVVGYYGLLDLGFRGGVNQYLSRYVGLRDYRRVSECASTAVAALGGLGALICVISIVAAWVVPGWMKLPDAIRSEAFWCILLVGLAGGIQCAFFPFSAVFTATQRYDLSSAIGISFRLLTAGGTWLALQSGHGLVVLSAITSVGTTLDYIVRWYVARRLLPEMKISRTMVNRERVREIASFGVWNFLISCGGYLAMHADTLIIGSMVSVAAIARYALAVGLTRQIMDVVSPVGQVFYPVAVQLHARGEKRELEELYIHGSRLMLIVVGCISIIAFSWADDFYRLWVGAEYVQNGQYISVATLFRVLLIGVCATCSSAIAGQVLLGAGAVRLVAISVIGESLLTVAMAVTLIRPLGLLGVAVGAMVAPLVVRMIVLPIFAETRLGLSVRRWVTQAAPRPIGIGILLVAATQAIRAYSTAANWTILIVHGVLAGSIALALIVVLGLNAEERGRFVMAPVRRAARYVLSPRTAFSA